MSTVFKAAFIFIAPKSNPNTDYSWVKTNEVHVKTVAVAGYTDACTLLDSLIAEGIQAVELCAGFGHQGTAAVAKAARGRLEIGVVRFDRHPCLNHVSGDELFLS